MSKSFKNAINPATQFITQPEELAQAMRETTPPAGYKLDPRFIETRSKRFVMLMQPSLLERVKAAAVADGVSTSEFVHRLLDKMVP